MFSAPHARPPEPTGVNPKPTYAPAPPTWASYLAAALFWFLFGFKVIPIRPGTKATAVRWDEWLSGLSRSQIISHWRQHPDHEVGFIVGDAIVVFDADSPEALASLKAAEACSGVMPLMVVQTKRGQHHYFGRDPGSPALPSARHFPKSLDVKSGRTMVILPPSTGKVLLKMGASQ